MYNTAFIKFLRLQESVKHFHYVLKYLDASILHVNLDGEAENTVADIEDYVKLEGYNREFTSQRSLEFPCNFLIIFDMCDGLAALRYARSLY